jgi:hypothetical protein
MRTKEAVKPLQECAKHRETIELYFQQGARRGLNDDCAANLLRWRVSEVDVPMDKFSPGSTYVGGNFGAGILYNITLNWGLHGSYNFHAVNTPGAVTKFSTLQTGIRFVF